MLLLKNLYIITIAFLFIEASSPDKRIYALSKDSSITIHGTSNLHSWVERAGSFSGTSSVNLNDNATFDMEGVNIKIDVRSIKSEKGTIMNNNTYKALKADAYPQILFNLNVPVKSIPKINNQFIIAKGTLSIAGITQSIDMKVKLTIFEQGKLSFEGAQTIKMTDYNIKPPTAMLGTLKTGNEITINFKVNFVNETN